MIHRLVTCRWWTLFFLMMVGLYALIVLFALLIYADKGELGMAECFHLSLQSFTTIGYGVLGPSTLWANLVISLQEKTLTFLLSLS